MSIDKLAELYVREVVRLGCLRVLYQIGTRGSHWGFESHCRRPWALS